jgi:hypothetical protein
VFCDATTGYDCLTYCDRASIAVCVAPLQSLVVDEYNRFLCVGLRVESVGSFQNDHDA